MNPIRANDALKKYLGEQLSFLTQYALTNQCPVSGIPANEFIQVTNPDDVYEFNCLGNTFIVQKKYYPFDGVAYLSTYQVITNYEDYPKKRLELLPEMEIAVSMPIGSYLKFVNPVKSNIKGTGAIAAYLNNADTAIISNFAEQYIRQLYQVLEIRYKHPQKQI